MRFFLALSFFAVLGAATISFAPGGPSVAKAQEAELRIVNHRVQTDFPTDVKFFVEVAGPDEIEEVRVYMKTIGQTSRSDYRQVEFEPGNVVSGEAELLTSGNNYVPPGTRLAYSFEVTDKAGRTLRTEDEVFVYLDTRFEWLSVSEGIVTVYYNNPLVESRAEHVLETALASMEITGPLLGIDPDMPLHIVTYHNYQDMVGALPFRSQATRERLVTAGMAFDKERVLLVHSGSSSVTGTTAHEFVHLLVGDALGRAYPQVPAWLNEGLAEYGSIHSGERDILNSRVERAIADGSLRPLSHLGSYSGTPDEILYAYAHGESVVTFMVEEYGEERMAELMRALARTFDIDAALEEVYGLDQHGLDSAWREAIGLEPLPPPEGSAGALAKPQRPEATIAPVLVPTFPPLEATSPAPVESDTEGEGGSPDSTRRPEADAEAEPTSAVPEPQAPEEPNVRTEEPQASGGCGAASVQSGMVGELSLILLLGMPLGLVLARRRRSEGK